MVKPKSCRPWKPEQTLTLPPSPVEWLPENPLVFFPADQAAELDLEATYAVYRQKHPRGGKGSWEDAAFRVLSGNQKPDHRRISDFRLRHLDALAGLFVPVLRLCQVATRPPWLQVWNRSSSAQVAIR
jgi:hypothetical protein